MTLREDKVALWLKLRAEFGCAQLAGHKQTVTVFSQCYYLRHAFWWRTASST